MKIRELLEAGAQIGRIIQGTQRGPYLIMSAWRGQFNRSENRRRNADLSHRLFNDYGLASVKQQGHWPIEKDNDGNIMQTGHEDSVFVPINQPASRLHSADELIMVAKRLMNDYNQDTVIVNDGKVTYLMSNPNRPDFVPPGLDRLGDGIRVFSADKSIGDAEGWSQKRNYRYMAGEKNNGPIA